MLIGCFSINGIMGQLLDTAIYEPEITDTSALSIELEDTTPVVVCKF